MCLNSIDNINMNKNYTKPCWHRQIAVLALLLSIGLPNSLYAQLCANDTIAPTIALNTADTIYHEQNTPYNAVQPTVTDNCSGPSRVSITQRSNVNVFIIECYFDEYTATDENGNTTIKNRWVCVEGASGNSNITNPTDSKALKIYPNPSRGIFNVVTPTEVSDASTLCIRDIHGTTIAQDQLMKAKNIIDLTPQTSGIYFVTLSNNNNLFVQKIIIQ